MYLPNDPFCSQAYPTHTNHFDPPFPINDVARLALISSFPPGANCCSNFSPVSPQITCRHTGKGTRNLVASQCLYGFLGKFYILSGSFQRGEKNLTMLLFCAMPVSTSILSWAT